MNKKYLLLFIAFSVGLLSLLYFDFKGEPGANSQASIASIKKMNAFIRTPQSENNNDIKPTTSSQTIDNPVKPTVPDKETVLSSVKQEPAPVTNTVKSSGVVEVESKNTQTQNDPTMSKESLVARKKRMIVLAETDQKKFIASVFPQEIRRKIPASLQAEVEKEIITEGTLEVIHADNFEDESKSYFIYTLRQGEKGTRFYVPTPLNRASGEKIKITGFKIGDIIVAQTTNFTSTSQGSHPVPHTHPDDDTIIEDDTDYSLASVGDQKTLVFLVRFQNSGPVPFSKSQAEQMVFNGQLQKFYKEQSYNKVSLSGTVVDWTTMSNSSSGANGAFSTCQAVDMFNPEIQSAITRNGIALGNYSRALFLLEGPGMAGGCSGIGKSDIRLNGSTYSLSQSWVGLRDYNTKSSNHPFAWTRLDFVMSHELGHALGVMHANGWDCGTNVIGGNCSHVEYGNVYDTMGDSNSLSLHFNAFYKELLGWITPSSIVDITNSGTYTINPLEGVGLSAQPRKLAAKIRMKNSNIYPFYLEYRRGLGFDSQLKATATSPKKEGLFVNKIWNNQGDLQTELLDMKPTPSGWWQDVLSVLPDANSIFNDPERGISIGPITSQNIAGLTFKVNVTAPVCIRRNPTVVNNSSGQGWRTLNTWMFVFIVNNDSVGCGSSEFYLDYQNISLPVGWGVGQGSSPVLLSPESGQVGFSYGIIIPANAILGNTYPTSINLINRNTGLKTPVNTSITIIQ